MFAERNYYVGLTLLSLHCISSYLRLGLSSDFFPAPFLTKILYSFLSYYTSTISWTNEWILASISRYFEES